MTADDELAAAIVHDLATHGPMTLDQIDKRHGNPSEHPRHAGWVARLLEQGLVVPVDCAAGHDHSWHCLVGLPREV